MTTQAKDMFSKYPPDHSKDQEAHLLQEIKDWSIANGLAVRPPDTFVQNPTGVIATPAPVTLWPSLFPRACFEEAKAVQTAYNELYSAIARDEKWLGELVEE